MESSKLKLYPDKTDLIIINTKQQQNRVINLFPGKLLGSNTFPSDTVRNLGVIFDSDFNFRQHISQVCKSYFYDIFMTSVGFGVTYLYLLLKQYQRH